MNSLNQMDFHLAFISIGANLGETQQTVLQAFSDLEKLPNSLILKKSSLYISEPIDANGSDYCNAVVLIQTQLKALDLLHHLQDLENKAGRVRSFKNAPRTLDLDLLRFDHLKINTPELILPHPRMLERAFVLLPLFEIAPEEVTHEQLLAVQHQRISMIS